MKQQTTIRLQARFLTVLMVLVFTLSALTCKPEPDPICECVEKEHLGVGEKCCNGTDCDCTLKVYGVLSDIENNKFNIYRSGNIIETQMTAAVTNVQAGYDLLDNLQKNSLLNKLFAIHIVPESEWGCDSVGNGQYVIKFGYNLTPGNIRSDFAYYINNEIVKSQQHKNIKLAQATPTMSVTVTIPNKS